MDKKVKDCTSPMLCICVIYVHVMFVTWHNKHMHTFDVKRCVKGYYCQVSWRRWLVFVLCVCILQVVFSAVQLSWLSAEQAWAVTEEQWAELDTDQRHAVGLARYEGDVLLEMRGVTVITFYFNKLIYCYFIYLRKNILYIALFIMTVLWCFY